MRARLVALALALFPLFPGGSLAAGDLTDLALQQHPGATLPLDLELADEHGRIVPLVQFFAGTPVLLVLEYLRCRTLCGLTLQNMVAALDALPLDAGRDLQVVAISIDPRDTPADAAAAKARYLAGYHHPGRDEGWHFLTGAQPVVRRIAETIGFPYRYDPELDQYLHPPGFVLVAPNGNISRYIIDIYLPAADLSQSLADAARGRIMTVGPLTRLLLLCRGQGTSPGPYTVAVEAALAFANIAGVAALIAVFAAIRRRS